MSATKPVIDHATAQGNALAGASVLITRPAGTARALAAQVRARGGVPLLLPGLSVRSERDPALAQRMRDGRFDDWIFSSPAAVRACFELLPNLRLPRAARAFAVGTGTRRALARHAIEAIAPPTGADSDALLAVPELARLRGRHVALRGAPGGRNLIAPALRARKARLEVLHVYQRRAPRLDRRHFKALEAAAAPWLTVLSSAEALDHLCALLPAALAARWRAQPLIVASERLAALARGHGFADVTIARSAVGSDLLDGAARWLARHRL